jgi:hypothetical protein
MTTSIPEMRMLCDTLNSLTGISTATQQSLLQITAKPEPQDAKTQRCLSKSIKSLTKSIETMKALVVFYENKIQEEVGKTRVTRHMKSAKYLVDSFRAVQEEDKQQGRTTLTRRQTIGGVSSSRKTSSLQTIADEETRGAVSRDHDISGTSDVNARVSAKIADILRERGEDTETVAEYIRATPTLTNPVVADEDHTSSSSRARSALNDIVPAQTATIAVDHSDDEETTVSDTINVISVKTLGPRPAKCATMPAQYRTSGRVLKPILETPCPREDGSNRRISFSSLVAGIVKT